MTNLSPHATCSAEAPPSPGTQNAIFLETSPTGHHAILPCTIEIGVCFKSSQRDQTLFEGRDGPDTVTAPTVPQREPAWVHVSSLNPGAQESTGLAACRGQKCSHCLHSVPTNTRAPCLPPHGMQWSLQAKLCLGRRGGMAVVSGQQCQDPGQ